MASDDRMEFQMATSDAGSFAAVPGDAVVAINSQGVATVTPTIPGAAAALGTTTTPNRTALAMRFRARVVDAAGNAGPWSTVSSHRLGLFNCLDLKARYPSHNPGIDSKAPASCSGSTCHAQSPTGASAIFQRLPGGTQSAYWCTFDPPIAAPVSSLLQFLGTATPTTQTSNAN